MLTPPQRPRAFLFRCRQQGRLPSALTNPACGAYLQGVLDMMIVARGSECGAPRYDRNRLRSAYLRWAEDNSYFMDVHMVAGAEQALAEAWPCAPRR
ncbi:Rap1a/Tai family immunity protein [Sphingobium sp.]|uniref:Rap1a/Tai family immunity protein n=1 Tax=Sphingobium sp. TaxID=1912891 RepID=UPI003BAE8E7F